MTQLHNSIDSINIVVYSTCDENLCINNGTCQYHAGNYICTCLPGFTEEFCEQKQKSKLIIYGFFSILNISYM